MASGGITREPIPAEEDEVKGGEAKMKRRFRPLDAVRKLFSKTRRKHKEEQVSVVAVKAKSTTALHHDDDDDDDGGFKNRQLGQLGGNRSISEDSVFSPDQKEVSNLQKLKKSAVSEERLPITKSLHAELFSKVRNRRSQNSDDDDGLPHSPTPPVTTADIIMGGPLKPLPVGGKSTSRESDNSLISVDASDNEEDPFQNKWKRAVPSKTSASPGTSISAEGHIDLNSIEQTVLLKSNIAKDRISVAPKRKSRKKRDVRTAVALPSDSEPSSSHQSILGSLKAHSPHSLPSLNEESPTKSAPGHKSSSSDSLVPEDISLLEVRASPSNTLVVTMTDKPGFPDSGRPHMTLNLADPRPAVAERPKSSTTPVASGSPVHTPVRPYSAEPVLEDSGKHSIVMDDTSKEGKFLDAKRPEAIIEGSKGTPSTAAKALDVSKRDFGNLTPSDSSLMSGLHHVATPALQTIEAPVTEAETFSIKPKSEISSSASKFAVSRGSEPQTGLTEGEGSASARITIINTSATSSSTTAKTVSPHSDTVQPPTAASPPPETTDSPLEVKKDGLRPTERTSALAFSPKDDYKLRRQHRSKTLPEPVAKEEQFANKVQRTASHRAETTSSQNASPDASPHLGPPKASEPAKSTEPAWFELARKKTGRQDSDEHKESPLSPAKELLTSTVAASFKEAAVTPVTEIQSTASSSSKAETSAPSALNSPESISMSSAFSKFESKPSEGFHLRSGSVKTSPSKSNPLSARGGSVKVTPAKVEHVSGMLSVGTTQVFHRGPGASPSTAAVTSPLPVHTASKDEVKEAKVAETPHAKEATFKDIPPKEAHVKESPAKEAQAKEAPAKEASAKEVPKWKAPVFKTPQSLGPSPPAATWSQPAARFGAGRASTAEPQPAPPAATPALAPKAQLSPAKKMPLAKTLSEEKEKSPGAAAATVGTSSGSGGSVPAWRANLGPKKPVGLDTGGLKIELIESTSNQAVKKPELAKPAESPLKSATSAGKELPQEQYRSLPPNPRTSKVMNLLKNFENVQGVS